MRVMVIPSLPIDWAAVIRKADGAALLMCRDQAQVKAGLAAAMWMIGSLKGNHSPPQTIPLLANKE